MEVAACSFPEGKQIEGPRGPSSTRQRPWFYALWPNLSALATLRICATSDSKHVKETKLDQTASLNSFAHFWKPYFWCGKSMLLSSFLKMPIASVSSRQSLIPCFSVTARKRRCYGSNSKSQLLCSFLKTLLLVWKVDVAELLFENANCSCLKPPITDSLLLSGSKKENMLYSLPLSWQIRGFKAPGLRKLSWHTPEVLVHEEAFQDKTGAMPMAMLRGDRPMMACIPTNDSTVFTCAGRMRCFFENAKTST